MNDIKSIGLAIKDKRLSLNLRMDDVAREANITRATLSAIENGKGNCSINTILKILDILGLSFTLGDKEKVSRSRASRTNTLLDKKINRFILVTIGQYAKHLGCSTYEIYDELKDKGVLYELKYDYEDLHGMSTMYLNDYIDAITGRMA